MDTPLHPVSEADSPDLARFDVFNRLLKDRIVFLGTDVNDDVANFLIAQMLFLEPIPRLPYPPASPHCSNGEEVVQEYQPVVHRLRLSASA